MAAPPTPQLSGKTRFFREKKNALEVSGVQGEGDEEDVFAGLYICCRVSVL